VYCRDTSGGRFHREHVIPKSLGSFRESLTVGCVCDECNRYFGQHLELGFARDSAESVARYRQGLRDSESASRATRTTARINIPGPLFGARVLLRPNQLKNGIETVYLPQVAFKNEGAEEFTWYRAEELTPEVVQTLRPGSVMTLLVNSPAEERVLRSRLQELGIGATKAMSRNELQPNLEMKTRVTCDFDFNMSRCVAKIAFNYLAFALEENTNLLLRPGFDAIRNYVRFGPNPEKPIVYFSNKPNFDGESGNRTFVDGHVVAVGWDSTSENIGCVLSLFNTMSYRVVLCRKYEGLWFPLQSAHSFDFKSLRTARVPLNLSSGPIL
jgi:hypothetical protein